MASTKYLKKEYKKTCERYVEFFCKKQKMKFNGWVNKEFFSIALCNDLPFEVKDIFLDINTKQPKGNIISWYYDNVYLNNSADAISYHSYINGLRVSVSKKDNATLKDKLKEYIYSYKTKHLEGFTEKEIKEILYDFNINEKKFNQLLGVNTCMVVDKETLTYHSDILGALLLSLEWIKENNFKNI